jgi:FSR family fosmidomycin resistance protein-like MFS transporter
LPGRPWAGLYGLPVTSTAAVVTAYMVCSAGGMLIGGWIASRVVRVERTIACAGSAAALLLVATGLAFWPTTVAVLAVALAGLGAGISGPSRDLLVKRATPPGATGRVYGLVYSGADVGFAASAPVLGRLLDAGMSGAVFHAAAAALAVAVVLALQVARQASRSRELGAAPAC